MSPQHNIPPVLKGTEKHGNLLCLSLQSLSSYPPFVCVCAQHNCSISSGFSPCNPLEKWLKNRISATIVQETHCDDSRHFSCKPLKSSGRNLQCNRRRVDKSMCYETTRVRALRNEISSSTLRMCCSTNARSIVCHPHFTNYSHFSHATMLPKPSVIQMKHSQHCHPKHGNLTIYSSDSPASIMTNSELTCGGGIIQTSPPEKIPAGIFLGF